MRRRNFLPFLLILFAGIVLTEAFSEEKRYYRSNEFGMKLEPIGWYRSDDYRFVLIESKKIENGAAKIEIKLLDDGKEVKEWVRTLDKSGTVKREKYLEKGIIVRETLFLSDGRISEERDYVDGKPDIRILFTYYGRRLRKKMYYDSKGNHLYDDIFSLNDNGSLRYVVRKDEREVKASSMYVQSTDGITDDVQYYQGTKVVSHYDRTGRLLRKDRFKGGKIVESNTYVYNAETGRISSEKILHYDEGTTEEKEFNKDGQLISRVVLQKEIEIIRESITWENGLMAGKVVHSKENGIEEYKYFYDSKGKLERENYYHRGKLEKSTRYTGENERVESLYRKGEIFMKVYYRGEERVKEEVISGGKVIRERILKRGEEKR